MKISLKKKLIIILLLVLLSVIAIFLYKNMKEDHNLTIIKANELEGRNSENSVTYTIVFNTRGGTGGPDRIETTEKNGIIPGERPIKTGYYFLGWATFSNPYEVWGTPNVYYNLDTLSEKDINDDGTIDLYAVWGRKIILNTGYNFTEIIANEKGNNTMPSQEPTRTGFEFLGWGRKSNPNQVWCVAGGNYNLVGFPESDINDDGTIDLYAVWGRNIIFDAKGGTFNISHIIVSEKADHNMTSQEPTRTGFKFEGWATKSNPNQVWCVAGGEYNLNTLSEEDINDDGTITLIAVWKEDTNPTNPDEGNTDPTDPDEGNTDPTDPDEGNTDPTDPDEGNTKPTNPDEGNTKPTNPDEGNTNPTNPDKNNTNPTNPNKNNIDQTTSNKNNTNTNQLNTAPMPLSYTGNETNYEKIVIIGILVCATTAIVLYFKLRNANY